MKKLIAPILIDLILISIIMSCDSKKSTEPEPTFNNFQDEVQYIIESDFPVGSIAVGVIKGD